MNWTDLNLISALPEIVLVVALFSVLLVDLWIKDNQRYLTHWLSIISVALVTVVQLMVWTIEPELSFNGMFVLDGFSQFSKVIMNIVVIGVFIYSRTYIRDRNMYQGEFYTLTLFALLGMMVMVSATHFLLLYVGLEILSLALYALIALRRTDGQAAEAALKYFVLGALASGILLYGVSLIYGATGSLLLSDVLSSAAYSKENIWLLRLGLLFIVAAIAFKLGAVPFHMWVPDVYQGAPTAVATLIGTAPKIAATVFAFRILVTGLATVSAQNLPDWLGILNFLAIMSLIVGNLAAIMQTNIKRMLAYSTISHMGFILLAFMGDLQGFASALYYAVTYALMAALAFGVLMLLSRQDYECEQISDLAGLNQHKPWYAFTMLLAMFSMAGIPPLMGFYAKFAVIKSLLDQGYIWVSVFAVIMSLIGAFYYLRIVKTMYFDTPHEQFSAIETDKSTQVLLSLNALALLLFGIFPDAIMSWCIEALHYTL